MVSQAATRSAHGQVAILRGPSYLTSYPMAKGIYPLAAIMFLVPGATPVRPEHLAQACVDARSGRAKWS
eukprot:scaffold56498_cov75-Phaeocystis_antarctica.AAC.2